MSEHREIRDRSDRARRVLDGRSIDAQHSPRRHIGRVITDLGSGATSPVYVDTNPVAISGPAIAGGSAARTPDAAIVVPVLILGSAPALGQDVAAKNIRGRWVARLPGATGGGGGNPVTMSVGACGNCGGLDFTLSQADVVVYSGTLVAGEGLDEDIGYADFDTGEVPAGSYDLAVEGLAYPRYISPTVVEIPNGGTVTVFIQTAEGYICPVCCGYPISTKLLLNGETYTWTGSTWELDAENSVEAGLGDGGIPFLAWTFPSYFGPDTVTAAPICSGDEDAGGGLGAIFMIGDVVIGTLSELPP